MKKFIKLCLLQGKRNSNQASIDYGSNASETSYNLKESRSKRYEVTKFIVVTKSFNLIMNGFSNFIIFGVLSAADLDKSC